MNIIIFEDEGYKRFLPLTWTRPVYDLRCGINTLAEKIVRQYPRAKVEYGCRYYLPGSKVMKFERGLFINGRLLAHPRLARDIPLKGKDEIFYAGDEIVAIRAVSKNFDEVKKKARTKRINARVLKYPWELIVENGGEIIADRKYRRSKKKGRKDRSVVVYNPQNVIIDEGAVVEANSVIDARSGPVYIGRGTIIRPLAYLKGPLSIGPMCRLGGEIGESIVHGHSNKQHYGFIGHSYIGEWVNLGAGTTNSDLKNNYGTVKVVINDKEIDTGLRFLGCFIADHAKTGIGTLITTGAVIGVAANLVGGRVCSRAVPSFSWLEEKEHKLDKALKTAAIAMKRRSAELTSSGKQLLEKVFELTRAERKS
jgi:UDP-N-acetylglucosamine diphosphorylase/glucosamine-1-phosphate N-acetyltransferase